MTSFDNAVVIVGGGLAGLACARQLHARGVPFALLEACHRLGGRIKTDEVDGYRLDHGFQVLQTAYPEARRVLDYPSLELGHFSPGVIIRIRGRFYTIADPLRQPASLVATATAPIGGLADRIRLLRLAYQVSHGSLKDLFEMPEMTAQAYLKARGFSDIMVRRFFMPFFGGVCLDPHIRASSRVLQYVMRMFATGDAALPARGMEAIPRQLAKGLPLSAIHTGWRVQSIGDRHIQVANGETIHPRAIVLATEGPQAQRLLGQPVTIRSIGETCLYYALDQAEWQSSFLVLNGDGVGPINNIAFPNWASRGYAPAGKSLASVVVLGDPDPQDQLLRKRVKEQLVDWFGPEAMGWKHLRTYHLRHALPDQSPPTSSPFQANPLVGPGFFVCGEYGSLPGIQWALRSGRQAADAVSAYIAGAV